MLEISKQYIVIHKGFHAVMLKMADESVVCQIGELMFTQGGFETASDMIRIGKDERELIVKSFDKLK